MLHSFLPFAIHLPLLVYFIRELYRYVRQAPLQRWFGLGLGLKLLAGVVVGLLYLYHYPYRGDTFQLFEESAALSKFAFRHPVDYVKILFFDTFSNIEGYPLSLYGQPRAFFTAKLLSIINLFTFHNYWITGLYLSLFSFWGLWRLANVLVRWYPETEIAAAVAFLLFPSVVFWSSGVLKESIVMGCLAGGLAQVFSLSHSPKERGLKNPFSEMGGAVIFFLFMLWILWKIKFYYLGTLAPALVCLLGAFFLNKYLQVTNRWVLALVQILFFIGVFNAAVLLLNQTRSIH